METDILKHFVGKDIEVLVSGIWIEGRLQQIAKGIVTLLPIDEMASFYGPAAMKIEVIQAVRQIKRVVTQVAKPADTVKPASTVKSAFESLSPAERFKNK